MGSRTPHAVLARHRSDPSVTPLKTKIQNPNIEIRNKSKKKYEIQSCGGWIRTTDIRVQSPALLPLNYPAMGRVGIEPT
jgi:hypothetical protein